MHAEIVFQNKLSLYFCNVTTVLQKCNIYYNDFITFVDMVFVARVDCTVKKQFVWTKNFSGRRAFKT